MKVKFVPVVDYAATVEGLAADRLDIVWYGGFTSVQATERAQGATRLAMREEDASFKSVFVARTDSGIKGLTDLKGKTFAFGSVSSTSGHLMPRHFLRPPASSRSGTSTSSASAAPTTPPRPGWRPDAWTPAP